MRYRKLGRTGLEISAIGLGCMSFGEPDRGAWPWSLDEETSRPFIRSAVEHGVNFFDTANFYSLGSSEEILGRALADYADRDDVVVATKVFSAMRPGPNSGGLSRKVILSELDHSLRRLNLDYIDLYQIHRFDPNTPAEEVMGALDDAVRSGKVRYIGASSMWAWQFAKLQHVAERNGWSQFVSMQDHYNLLNREEEREMLPLCADLGVGVIPWSPLARGRLTRPWDEVTERARLDEFGEHLYGAHAEADKKVVDAVAQVAEQRGVPRAQVALAWVMQRAPVTAPIVGVTKSHHLEDAVAAVDLELSAEEVATLEAPYVPHPVAGGFS